VSAARLRVAVDCRYVRIDHHDGISRYTAGLVGELAQRHDVTMLVHDERQLRQLPALPHAVIGSPTGPGEPWRARQVNRLRPDVVFSPMQTMGTAGRRYRVVLTIHDLIYYTHRTPPRDLPAPVRLLWRLYHLAWWPQRLLLRGADAVVTVSAATGELLRRHRLTDKRIVVVPNAPEPHPPVPPRRASDSRELLYMGAFAPYKNAETLARAMHELPGYRLHLLSRIPAGERARLEALAPAGSLVVHDGTPEDEYRDLLQSAFALLTASREEGFGIPLVEAMSWGTPVVVSDIPIFREIGGEAASFASPDSPAAFAAAVRALEPAAEWERRSALSLEQAARYRWDAAAEQLSTLLEDLAAGR